MTGKGLVKRILLTLALTAGFFILLAVEANATPIRPDLQKLLDQPQATTQFVPARAGWQGPEMSTPKKADLLDQSAAGQSMRATLLAAAIPDIRILALIALVILLLRRMRRPRPRIEPIPAHEQAGTVNESPPAKAA